MANELATRSMLELDSKSHPHDSVDHAVTGSMAGMNLESPHTPSSPSKRKFSFKFSGRISPKNERRNFSQEAASIPDLQVSHFALFIFFEPNVELEKSYNGIATLEKNL